MLDHLYVEKERQPLFFRPMNDDILVKADPAVIRNNAIIVDIHGNRSPVLTGIVLEVGPGKYPRKKGGRIPLEVKKGDHIVFFRFHKDTTMGKATSRTLQDLTEYLRADVYVIPQSDVLFAIELEEGESMPRLDL